MASSSAMILRAILRSSPKHAEPLLHQLQIELSDDVEARVPFELLIRAWGAAAELSGDPWFGLHFGERLTPGAFDVVDYAARSSATLGEAIQRLLRYQRLLHDAVHVSLESGDGEARLVHTMDGAHGEGARHAAEAAMASYLTRMRGLTGRDLLPRLVSFSHAAPEDAGELRRVFRAPLAFGAPADELVFDADWLLLPMVGADPELRKLVERQADAMLERLPAPGLLPELSRTLQRLLPDGEPRLAQVAKRLGMSSRALQRRLAAEGRSFQAVVDELRHQLALRYLDETRLPVGDVAFLLGFSEPSAFTRAFRRWTGRAPSRRI